MDHAVADVEDDGVEVCGGCDINLWGCGVSDDSCMAVLDSLHCLIDCNSVITDPGVYGGESLDIGKQSVPEDKALFAKKEKKRRGEV